MEQFKFTPQAIAFLSVVAVLAIAVTVLAPLAAVALGALAVVLLPLIWLKAAIRSGKIVTPFTAVEGAIALSALLLVGAGISVTGYVMWRIGTGHAVSLAGAMLPGIRPGPPVGSKSVHYSDPDRMQRLKDELAKAGVPYTVQNREGKEFIAWPAQHNATAEAIDEKLRNKPWPNNRNAFFKDPDLRKQFTDWLTEKGIKHETVMTHGEPYIVWEESGGDAAKDFMTQRKR
jgi:hypothetical protein